MPVTRAELRAEMEQAKRMNADLTIKLMRILGAFKRGTPIGHAFCECVKCRELYEAVHAATMYETATLKPEEELKECMACKTGWGISEDGMHTEQRPPFGMFPCVNFKRNSATAGRCTFLSGCALVDGHVGPCFH